MSTSVAKIWLHSGNIGPPIGQIRGRGHSSKGATLPPGIRGIGTGGRPASRLNLNLPRKLPRKAIWAQLSSRQDDPGDQRIPWTINRPSRPLIHPTVPRMMSPGLVGITLSPSQMILNQGLGNGDETIDKDAIGIVEDRRVRHQGLGPVLSQFPPRNMMGQLMCVPTIDLYVKVMRT